MKTIHLKVVVVVVALFVTKALYAQETTIGGFTDVDFKASDQTSDHPAFSIGQYDLYVSSELADRLSFLGETGVTPLNRTGS
ncbi:MAG: hypothetical protein HYR76_13795 [Ignavibacteria bacterium]|nr:hypothetical protein [Ignavibacteria bacterium]